MITQDKLNHILAVSRQAYNIAKRNGFNEEFARKCFMLGWTHDVGYEFCNKPTEHPEISVELLESLGVLDLKVWEAIRYHSAQVKESDEWKILTEADMTVNSKGEPVSVSERLNEIKWRYGKTSEQYLISKEICEELGILDKTP